MSKNINSVSKEIQITIESVYLSLLQKDFSHIVDAAEALNAMAIQYDLLGLEGLSQRLTSAAKAHNLVGTAILVELISNAKNWSHYGARGHGLSNQREHSD